MTRLPQTGWLADGKRLHLQDGPIDLIVEARGTDNNVRAAYEAAVHRFTGLLDALCDELPELRRAAHPDRSTLQGRVARNMHAAVAPYAMTNFITPMAAVAGAVAEEVLGAMTASAELKRAYVNNGGDIALHLANNERFTVGLVDHPGMPSLIGKTGHRSLRSDTRHCDQRMARPQFLARDRRRGDRSCADRRAGGCRCDNHLQRGRSAGASLDRPPPRERGSA